jgi:hypothetical protein
VTAPVAAIYPPLLHSLVVPFRAQAVGIGARWQVSQAISPVGLIGKTWRTYEVVASPPARLLAGGPKHEVSQRAMDARQRPRPSCAPVVLASRPRGPA